MWIGLSDWRVEPCALPCSSHREGPRGPKPRGSGEPGQREKYLGWVADGSLGDGYAADDYTALLFRDGALVEAVAERPGRHAYRVECVCDGRAREIRLPVRFLG